ncbi:MAG: HEAT repeat domain-containing protein [Bacteroidota bacterium]
MLVKLTKVALSHAPKVLEALLKAAGDSHWRAREATVSALGELAKAAPNQAPRVLKALLKAVEDSDYDVREAAANVLKEVEDIMDHSVMSEEKKRE